MTSPSRYPACRHRLEGRVQGLGVRPAVARLATELQLGGCVCNTSAGVMIEVMGPETQLDRFAESLLAHLPVGCQVDAWQQESLEPRRWDAFQILPADEDGPLRAIVPTDRVVCRTCQAEAILPGGPRHAYWLNSCANCGPRFSLIQRLPFEREQTSMVDFPLCSRCQAEFQSPHDRRFHAQTMGCTDCGPSWWIVDAAGRPLGQASAALEMGIELLRRGEILGLRGVGGYQLLCDATRDATVRELRWRKARPDKPFAVLVAHLEQARQWAELSALDQQGLESPSNPIVVAWQRPRSDLAPSVAPGLATLGLMLPTTAAHAALVQGLGSPLVCTSANVEGDPLFSQLSQTQELSTPLADAWLHHNRDIVHPVDDSVMRQVGSSLLTLRLARGLAPLPLNVSLERPTLALGGHWKAAMAWHNGSQAALGSHVGDLSSVPTRREFFERQRDWLELYRMAPEWLIHDAHPDYATTAWANQQPLEHLAVQHHLAHVAAVQLEHGYLDRRVLGIAWDGTGWGGDGSIWGGECLEVMPGQAVRRVGHVRPFVLPGGDRAAREPWRVALSLLQATLPTEVWLPSLMARWPELPVAALASTLRRPLHQTWTTSVGRLFDGVAALVVGATHNRYEGQAAMRLESYARLESHDPPGYPLPIEPGAVRIWDWRPLIRSLWQDVLRERPTEELALRFHRGLAAGVVAMARGFPASPVALGGGVFQNQVLVREILAASQGVVNILVPGVIPTNDGGLAAGQLAWASVAQSKLIPSPAQSSSKL